MTRQKTRLVLVATVWFVGVFLSQIWINYRSTHALGYVSSTGLQDLIVLAVPVFWPLLAIRSLGFSFLPPSLTPAATLGMASFLIAAALSCLVSQAMLISLGYLCTTIAALYIASQIASGLDLETARKLLQFYAIAVALLLCAVGVYDYMPGRRLGEGTDIINPNSLGMLAMSVAIASFSFRRKIIVGLYFGIGLTLVVLSGSRSSGAALICAVIFLAARRLTSRRGGTLVMALLAVVVGLSLTAAVFSTEIIDTLRGFFAVDDPQRGLGTGATGRALAWKWTWNLFLEHPLIGVGYRAHQYLIAASSAHNGYLALLAETGVFGFAGVVVLFAASIAGLLRARVADRGMSLTRDLFVALFVAYLIVGFFERFLINSGNPLSLLMLIALFVGIYQQRGAVAPRRFVHLGGIYHRQL